MSQQGIRVFMKTTECVWWMGGVELRLDLNLVEGPMHWITILLKLPTR